MAALKTLAMPVVRSAISDVVGNLTAIRTTCIRSFASYEKDGPVNIAEEIAANTSAGSWYAPSSVEARVSKKRKGRPDPEVGRTKPPPTEEDMWLAAGMPGYVDVDRSTEAVKQSPPPAWTPSSPSKPKAKLPGWAQLLDSAMGKGQEGNTAVRLSTAKVAKSSLPNFLQTYRLLVLPTLAGHSDCIRADLLVARATDQERQREEDAALEAANAQAGSIAGVGGSSTPTVPSSSPTGPETVTVTSVTEWSSHEAMARAAREPGYQAAMKQLATYMRGHPAAVEMNSAAGMDKRTGRGIEGSGTVEGVTEPQPGPELGLR